MKKIAFICLFHTLGLVLQAQVALNSCQALKQSSNSLSISDVVSGHDDYDVNYYNFKLDVTHATINLHGQVNSKSTAIDLVDTMWFHLTNDVNIIGCTINGNNYPSVIRNFSFVQVPLVTPINAGDPIDMTIIYEKNVSTSGYRIGYSHGLEIKWTWSEPFHAKHWFPVKEDLTDKIDSISMDITSPAGTFGASNGLLQSSTVLPNGKVRNVWKSNYLIDFYLIAFAVADYKEYSYKTLIPGETDSVLIQNFIYDAEDQGQPLVDIAQPYLDEIADMMEVFSDKYGFYPFNSEKYGIMMAPMGGGMEHQTMTTQSNFNSVSLTAHELGHQWWGNHVTCSNWNDIWLNEGFATYSVYTYYEATGQTTNASETLNYQHTLALNIDDGTVYAPDGSSASRIFNGFLSYCKGSVVIHMLRYIIKDDFFPFLKHYQEQNANGNSTTEEFKALLNSYTGEDLSWFIDEWIYGKGYPQYDIRWKQATDGVLWVDIDETPSSTDYFTMYVPLRLIFDDGTTEDIHYRPIEGQANIFSSYSSPKTIVNIELDPDNWILNGSSTIQETFPIGLNELSEQVDIIENPSSELIVNNTTSQELKIKLVDINGRQVGENISTNQSLIKVTSTITLEQGVYFVYISNSQGESVISKWIKR